MRIDQTESAEPSTDRSSTLTDDPLLTLDDRGRSVPWVARTLHRLYNAAAQKFLESENVSITHWIYLRVLTERGPLSQADLSKRAGIASQTTVPALDRLEQLGLVKRTRDLTDRRKYYVTLTGAGQALVQRLMPEVKLMLERSLQGISQEELTVFWKVTKTMTGNLSAMLGDREILD